MLVLHLANLLIEDGEEHLEIADLGTVVDSDHDTKEDGQVFKKGGSKTPLPIVFLAFALAHVVKPQVQHLKNEIN